MRIRVYPGQYYDQETGLHYNWHRDYYPAAGRYIQSDPVGLGWEENSLYIYATNNPILFGDPHGLRLCRITLPGLGQTYLDDAFSPLVRRWINANTANEIHVIFTQAFRPTSYQQSLQNNPSAITPAHPGNSLHECGFAVDISWRRLNCEERNDVVRAARNSGLSWGGDFHVPDVVHFYHDPGNRAARIRRAQDEYRRGVTYDCP